MRSALARATPVVTTNVKRTTTTTTHRRRSVAVRASKVRDDDASSSMACCRPRAARRAWVTFGCRVGCDRCARSRRWRGTRARGGGARGISHENRSWVSSRAFDRGMRAACVANASSIDRWMRTPCAVSDPLSPAIVVVAFRSRAGERRVFGLRRRARRCV